MRAPLKQLNSADREETLLAKNVISQIKEIKINNLKLIINIIPK